MEAQSKKSKGLNLNPLAPAESKRTFAFSGKNLKFHWKCIHFSSLFLLFFVPFSSLFQKSRKRDPESGERAVKIHQNGPQGPPKRRPGINKLSPKVHQVRKTCKIVEQGWQSGAPSATMESQGTPKWKKITKLIQKLLIKHENVPQGAEKHTSTHKPKQPTNQGNKKQNNQTNEQTPS